MRSQGYVSLLILPLLVACNMSVTATVTLPAPTETAARTATPLPTLTPTFPPTHLPSPTATFTPLPTWTPLPILSLDEAQAYSLKLFQNNGGCKLPCLLGVTPGVTTWEAARHFFAPFASRIGESELSETGNLGAGVVFALPEGENIVSIDHAYRVQQGIITEIRAYNRNFTPIFLFSQVLKDYGPPDEVWVQTYSEGYPDPRYIPFQISLYYSAQSFLLDYSVTGKVEGARNVVVGCPQYYGAPLIGMWSKEHEFSFSEAKKEFGWDSAGQPVLTLEEATGIDIATFYEVFLNQGTKTCLETPTSFWGPQF